MLSFLAKIY